MRRAALGLVAIAACFTGDSAQGLPCTADEFCAGLKCVDGFCGGPPDELESTSGAPTSTSDPTTTTMDPSPTSTTEVDTTSDPPTTSATETTGEPPAACELLRCWGGCFDIAGGDTFDADGSPIDLEVGRVDDDSNPDLFTVNSTGPGTGVLEMRFGTRDGAFEPGVPTSRPLADAPTGTALGDIDGEENSDAVIAYFNSDQVSVFLWEAGNYAPVSGAPFMVRNEPRDPVILDIDGIPPLDVAFATGDGIEALTEITADTATQILFENNYFIDDMIGVRFGNADALLVAHHSFGELTLYSLPPRSQTTLELRFAAILQPSFVGAGDFDGDLEADDVVIATELGDLYLAPSFLTGSGTYEDDLVPIGEFEGAPRGLAVGQIDGTCGVDVALITHTETPDMDDDVIVYRNDGTTLVDPIPLAQYGSNVVQIADLDGDGLGEVVIGGGEGDVRIARYSP